MKVEVREQKLELAERIAGHAFNDRRLLEEALTHRSYANEASDGVRDYDRLEFLGDSVLDLVTAEALYERFPDLTSGDMTKLRASLVNETSLAEIAQSHDLGDAMFLGVGELRTGGAEKPSVLADTYESLIAALYLDAGLEVARSMILRDMDARIEAHASGLNARDPKSTLQEVCVQRRLGIPAYRVVRREGPDHDTRYTVECHINGVTRGAGTGRNIKNAEQLAAAAVLEILGPDDRGGDAT